MSNERGYFSHVDAGRPVLEGHRRAKRKLLNPFSDLPALQSVNTTADIFPELLWIALLFETFGYHRALKIAVPLRMALAELDGARSWYRLSELAEITSAEWDALRETDSTFKADVVRALLPLQLYPQLRLDFLRDTETDRQAAVETLERCVGRHSNRFETPGAAMIGTFIFLEAYAGRISVPRGVLEGISAIVDKPGSDEAEIGASTARATALAFWSADSDRAPSWPAEFWRANLQISECRTKQPDA